MTLWDKIKAFFGFGPKPAPQVPQPPARQPDQPQPTPQPVPAPQAPPAVPTAPVAAFDRRAWSERALTLSQSFEGSDAFANITGNFDGTGLTCGALGWTVKWDNQDKLIRAFVDRHGAARGRELMPTKWDEYMAVINASGETGVAMAAKWSDGSSTVKEPYRSELRAFWRSPEMRAIQSEFADKDMGAYAEKMMRQFCDHQGIPMNLQVFAWFFDVKVHNGGMKTVGVGDGDGYAFSRLMAWASALKIPSNFASTKKDLDRNVPIWGDLFASMPAWQRALLGISQLRADLSNADFKADTLNRKGAIAAGKGWVHGELYDFRDQFGTKAPPAPPAPKPVETAPVTVINNAVNPAYVEAKKYEGKTEFDPAFNKFLSGFWGKTGLPGYKTIIGTSFAWCALFVVAMNSQVGQKYIGSAAAIDQRKTGVEINWRVDGIPKGAVVGLNHGGNCSSGSGNHVTFADGDCSAADLAKSGATFPGFGGNQGNAVKTSVYSVKEICAVRWPSEVPKPARITKSIGCGGSASAGESTR